MEWDHRNRLVKYTFQINYGTDYRILTYEYDAFDRRVNSHTISVSTGLATRSTYWVWDGQQLALQFSDGDGAGPSAPSRTYRFLYGPEIDQVFNQEGTGSTHWLLADHLGTTREVVDDSGTLQRHNVFDAYGNRQGSTAHTLIMFAVRELDAVSGLYYVRARWYDPAVGRWASEDRIGFLGGDTNSYRYVGNSPVSYTDPSGLARLKVDGQVFYVHPNDPDIFPSDPHCHANSPNSPTKIHIDTGEVFHGGKASGKFINRNTLAKLRQQMQKRGLLGIVFATALCAPEFAEAAERDGVSGVASTGADLVAGAAIGTATSVAVGGGLIAGASAAGTSITVGGAAAVGLTGAATVGGAVLAAGGLGYAGGTLVANTEIGDDTVAGHLGEGMFKHCPWCFSW